MKIFVSVVSFRDPLLKYTVKSLLDERSGENEITIGVFEQTCLEDSLITVDPELANHTNVKYKRIDPEYADGVVWARKINAAHIEDEDFMYQVDSHMLFNKNWDRYLLQDWELGRQKAKNTRVVLTAACHNFKLEDGEPFKLYDPNHHKTSRGRYFTFQKSIRRPAAHGEHTDRTEDVEPAIHIFAGNFFAPVRWVEEIGYDARIFFDGEEHYMVLKSFINGWSIFNQREMHCFHFLGTHEYVTKHWIDPITDKYGPLTFRGQKYWKKFIESISDEDLKKYHEYSGVDYINGVIEERAFTRQILDPHATGTPDSED
jgi:hypothetical protein